MGGAAEAAPAFALPCFLAPSLSDTPSLGYYCKGGVFTWFTCHFPREAFLALTLGLDGLPE